jgi:hypothetical protein
MRIVDGTNAMDEAPRTAMSANAAIRLTPRSTSTIVPDERSRLAAEVAEQLT